MPGRLNLFQRSMLEWNDLHPYNAVHVARVPAPLDEGRPRCVIRATLEAHGLTRLSLNDKRRAYRYHDEPAAAEVKVLVPGDSPAVGLQAEIEQQLNTRFLPAERLHPFRFFVEPQADEFSLGLVYFHAVADAEAIVRLLLRIVSAYDGGAGRPPEERPDIYPGRHDELFRQPPALLARKLAALPANLRAMRRACRPRYRDPGDFHNGFALFSWPAGKVGRLVETSRRLGVTLHDLFLALLIRALAPLAVSRANHPRRRRIAIGSIVNLRKDLGPAYARAFGLYLGSFVVTQEVLDGATVQALAQSVREQTQRIKRHKLYLGTPLELILGRWCQGLFSAARRKRFYQKHYPLWGGITNMNLNLLWTPQQGPKLHDYFRAVSTGPATPLVLSITTLGERLNIGLTYRTTVFGPEDIAQVRQDLLEGLQSLVTEV